MTKKRRKTTIITETDRLLVLNRHSGAVTGWCDDCEDLAGMVRPEEAVGLAAFRLGSVYRSLGLKELPGIQAESFDIRLNAWLKPA